MTKVNELVIGGLNDAVARIAVTAAEASGLGTAELPVNVALLLRDQGKLGAARALLPYHDGAGRASGAASAWPGGGVQVVSPVEALV